METKQFDGFTEVVDDTAPDNGAAAVFPPSHSADNGSVDTTAQAVHATDPTGGVTATSAPTTFQRTESAASDRREAQHEKASRFQRAIYLLFGVLDGLLVLGFVLPLLGANPSSGFARFIQGITAPFMAPFAGLFASSALNTLIAMLFYAVIAWVLAQVVWLFMGEMRRGNRTSGAGR